MKSRRRIKRLEAQVRELRLDLEQLRSFLRAEEDAAPLRRVR